jgi:hypothetical protein
MSGNRRRGLVEQPDVVLFRLKASNAYSSLSLLFRRLVPLVAAFHGEPTRFVFFSSSPHCAGVRLQFLLILVFVLEYPAGWSWTLLNLQRMKDWASVLARPDKSVFQVNGNVFYDRYGPYL